MKLARRYPALLAVPGRLRNSAYGLRQSSPTSPRGGCAARRGRRGRGPCRGLGWWLRRRLKRAVEWWWRAHAALSSSPFHGQLPLRMTWKGAPILDLQGACPETKYRSGPPKACLQTPHQTWLFGQCLKLSTPLCPSPPPSNAGRDGKGRGLSEAAGRVPQPPSRASSAGNWQASFTGLPTGERARRSLATFCRRTESGSPSRRNAAFPVAAALAERVCVWVWMVSPGVCAGVGAVFRPDGE